MTVDGDVAAGFDVADLGMPTVEGAPAPLVLEVRRDVELSSLDQSVGCAIRDFVAQCGAVLLRGTGVDGDRAVAAVAAWVFAGLPEYATGEHPEAPGAPGVYQPVDYAPDETLLWHHEDSFNAIWPRFVLFACVEPASTGGETTIVDSRLVYEAMPADVRDHLRACGVDYRRRCDGRAGRSWQQLYRTDDADVAREVARSRGEELTVDGDDAWVSARRDAFLAVPGGTSWFNQILHFHPAALPAEVRALVERGLVASFRSCAFGDGEPIAAALVDQLVEIHRRHELAVAWQRGDVLIIDNETIAHGRRPYGGARRHFVRMAGRPS